MTAKEDKAITCPWLSVALQRFCRHATSLLQCGVGAYCGKATTTIHTNSAAKLVATILCPETAINADPAAKLEVTEMKS